MTLANLGPQHWTSPVFDGAVPPVIIAGEPIAALAGGSLDADDAGSTLRTLGGTHSWQGLFEDPKAPISLTTLEFPFEVDLEDMASAQTIRRLLGLARDGGAPVYVDIWEEEEWIGDGTTTTWVLARSTPYGSTSITKTLRPPLARVGTYPSRSSTTDWMVVDGTPSGNQVQVLPAADSTTITTGNAVADGDSLILRYYPLRLFNVSGLSLDFEGRNEGRISAELSEFFSVRAFS